MDRNKLAEEGTLTQYILGELDMETTLALEELLASDPKLKQKVLDLEDQFEQIGLDNAIAPPASVREKLVRAMESQGAAVKSSRMDQPESKPFWRDSSWRIAAGIAILFGLTSLWFFTEWRNTRSDLEVLQNESRQLSDRLNALEQEISLVNTKYTQVNHPDVIPLVLVGNEQLPGSKVVAYMNHKSRSVVVNTAALPDLKNTQSYQMWADVDGVMIDMGLLDSGEDLISLRYIERAESLNITVEPYGGSEHPTVSNLISYVKI